MEEPFVRASIHTPQEYVGALMEVCQNKRGVFKDMVYEGQRVCLHYEMPLAEIIFDFFDQIKSRSRGYASYDYELCGYQQSDLVKLDILLNGDPCDALSMIVHRDRAYARGRSIAEKLKDVIPRQATSAASASCWKSRRRARSACASSATCRCPARRSWPC